MNQTPILAVASGKGGVGKTLTSVNIALTAASKNLKTALIDADPLSNVMTLLDHPVPERPLPEVLEDPESQAFSAAPDIEVLFPQAKTDEIRAASLVEQLLTRHRSWLEDRYDLIIVDMPAGAAGEVFPYLKQADLLLLVTNPEPTSHVAAGSFLRLARKSGWNGPIYFWHNKYEKHPDEAFNPDDVLGNHDRNVPEEERLGLESPPALAHVPPDPSLDLTRTDPPILLDLHRALADTLRSLAESALPSAADAVGERTAPLLSYYLRKAGTGASPKEALASLESFISTETGATLPDNLRKNLLSWLQSNADTPLRRKLASAEEITGMKMEALENEGGFADTPAVSSKALDREIIGLLKELCKLPQDSPMRPMAGLLLFRFTLLKLFTNETARKLILAFLPRREEGGQQIRDRRRQILRITGAEESYRQRYFALVKKLYPVVSRQLDHLVDTFHLGNLLFRNAEGQVVRGTYAKLFSATLYEMVNSGLGIVTGFRFRPSSRAFRTGFDSLLMKLNEEAGKKLPVS